MTNKDIAAAFDQIGDLLEFQNANPFRVRAYRNAARSIGDLTEPVADLVHDETRELTDLDGIGKDLADKITQLVTTGQIKQLEELKAQVPTSVLALLRVPGMGPKKAAVLFKELGIETLDQLRVACQEQRVRSLKGFGAKTEETILKGLAIAEAGDERTKWAVADAIVAEVLEHLRSHTGIKQLAPAGSYRRGCETIGDLDFLVEASEKQIDAVMDHFGKFPGIAEVIARGDTKMSVRLGSGMQMDLRVVPKKSFGAALQYFTGSKAHNVRLRGIAKKQHLKISEWGIFRVEDDGTETYLAGKKEQEIYDTLKLPYFPPEIREDREEFEWARQGKLPKLLETLAGVRLSQGAVTLDALKKAVAAIGTTYRNLCDSVREAPFVHTDDTGWREGGSPLWLMVFETDAATVFQIRPRHRNEEVRERIPADYAGVMIVDRGSSYEAAALAAVQKQTCLAHVLRTLSEVLETKTRGASRFAKRLKDLLQQAMAMRRERLAGPVAADFAERARRLKWMITDHLRDRSLQDPDNQRLLNELGRWHDAGSLVRFLDDPRIEPTNNRAERALRPAVIARKVSQCTKNAGGSHAFEAWTSVVRTLAKTHAGPDLLDALVRIMHPAAPQTT